MNNIKRKLITIILTAFLLGGSALAQHHSVASVGGSFAFENLDLGAVAEVFKDSEDLAGFEEKLNDSESGINNLDLDENGEVDYLRVEENVEGETHVVVLQSVLGENEFQDVATIAVEKEVNNYNFQIQGTPTLYGANYYVVPRDKNFSAWRLINWMYRPTYRPYRSSFGWRVYPKLWRVRRPVPVNVYRTRTAKFTGRRNFTPSPSARVKTVRKVRYNPKTSKLVKKKKVVKKNGKTTVKKGKKKTVKTKKGKKTKTKTKLKNNKNNK